MSCDTVQGIICVARVLCKKAKTLLQGLLQMRASLHQCVVIKMYQKCDGLMLFRYKSSINGALNN